MLVVAGLQLCGVYPFRFEVSLKSSFTHRFMELINNTLKSLRLAVYNDLVSVCTFAFRYLKYSFKQSRTHIFSQYTMFFLWPISNKSKIKRFRVRLLSDGWLFPSVTKVIRQNFYIPKKWYFLNWGS